MKLSHLLTRIHQKGPWSCMRWVAWRADNAWHEWRLGITTTGIIHWRDLGLDKNSESYEPIDYGTFALVLRRIVVHPDDVFLDYGCGLGRVLVLAARQPFRRLIGVELSPWLCSIAERNLQLAHRHLACSAVDIVNMDASAFAEPDDVSVGWLFSPFFGEFMKKVTARIRKSLEAAPRKLTIIHVIPDNVASSFLQCDWLSTTAEFRF